MSDNYENIGPGRHVTRDAEGKFKSASLDSETARNMVQARSTKDKRIQARARRILEDRGLNWDETDESLKALAEIGAEGRGGSVQAFRYLDRLTGRAPDDSTLPGEVVDEVTMLGKTKAFVRVGGDKFINTSLVDVEYWKMFVEVTRESLEETKPENGPEA